MGVEVYTGGPYPEWCPRCKEVRKQGARVHCGKCNTALTYKCDGCGLTGLQEPSVVTNRGRCNDCNKAHDSTIIDPDVAAEVADFQISAHEVVMTPLESALMERYTKLVPSRIDTEPPEFRAVLKIGVQEFWLYETAEREHAEWYRKMLGKALATLLTNEAQSLATILSEEVFSALSEKGWEKDEDRDRAEQ